MLDVWVCVAANLQTMIQLREYQTKAVEEIRAAYRAGRRSPLLVSPTGSGKTVVFSFIAHGVFEKRKRVIIAVHRQEIMRQISRSLSEFSVPHGLICPGEFFKQGRQCQVASVQTLARRLDKAQEPDLLVIDEAHHSVCESYRRIIAGYPNAKILGVTATPERLSGEGLGEIFDHMVLGPSVQQLIDDGFLSRPIYYAPPSGVDPSKLHILGGDFRRDESEAMMDKPSITGNAVDHYRRICDGVPAIAFCTSLKHAANVSDEFSRCGYATERIDGTMSDAERLRRTSALREGKIHVLVSVDLLGEGFDCPGASCGIMLRPTASLALHLQQIGRVLRPAPGKDRAIILDHVGNCLRHGLAEEPREWSLDSKRRARSKVVVMKNRQCPACYAVHAPAPKCPGCGHEYPVKPRSIQETEGMLAELTADQVAAVRRARNIEVGKAHSFAELLAIQRARGYKPGWVHFRSKFLRKPKSSSRAPRLDLIA